MLFPSTKRIGPPLKSLTEPASVHLLYILNNPLAGTDPTGYAAVPKDARGKFLDGYINSLPDNFGSVADFTKKYNGAEKLTTLGPGMCGREQAEAATVGGAGSQRPSPQMGPPPDDDAPRNFVELAKVRRAEGDARRAEFEKGVGDVIGVLNPLSREPNEVGLLQPTNPVTGNFISASDQSQAIGNVLAFLPPTLLSGRVGGLLSTARVGDGLTDLANVRSALGMGAADGTLARLEVGGQFFYGINAHRLGVSMRVNSYTKTHAEAHAFQQALNSGVRGGTGTLHVDRGLCLACGRNGGVRTMVRELGLDELTVVTTQGTQVIKP